MEIPLALDPCHSSLKWPRVRWLRIWHVGALCLLASFSCRATQPAFCFCNTDLPPMTGSPQVENLSQKLTWQASESDRQSALASLEQLADAGDAEAAFRVGRYFHIVSGHLDYARALFYYNKAAAKDHAWAMNNVGLLYDEGLGVPVDHVIARKFFEESANKGSELGYHNLARLHFTGEGGPEDLDKGLALLEKCAELKKSGCVYDQAALYLHGDYGIHKDYPKGIALAERAAEMGHKAATWGLAKLYLMGEKGLPLDIPRGLSMLRALSDQGYGLATASLGDLRSDPKLRNEFFTLHFGGEDQTSDAIKAAIPQDVSQAESFWLNATQQGYCRAFASLASVYDRGAGVPVNYTKAALYIADLVKCEPNNPLFLFKLGDRMTDAKGIPRDCIRARNLYYKSMSLGYSTAGANLGYIYDRGCDTILHDDKQAFQVYLACAKGGDPMCQNNVGAMLKHGRGVGDPDYVRAYSWMMIAAAQGQELAQKNLENYKDLFPAETREKGLEHAKEVVAMIHPGYVDMQALDRGDMDY
jgi:TPR repeat protein